MVWIYMLWRHIYHVHIMTSCTEFWSRKSGVTNKTYTTHTFFFFLCLEFCLFVFLIASFFFIISWGKICEIKEEIFFIFFFYFIILLPLFYSFVCVLYCVLMMGGSFFFFWEAPCRSLLSTYTTYTKNNKWTKFFLCFLICWFSFCCCIWEIWKSGINFYCGKATHTYIYTIKCFCI